MRLFGYLYRIQNLANVALHIVCVIYLSMIDVHLQACCKVVYTHYCCCSLALLHSSLHALL